jgi:hypothetical protein
LRSLSLYFSVSLSLYIYIYASMHLWIYVSIYLSIFISIYLSFHLSIYLLLWTTWYLHTHILHIGLSTFAHRLIGYPARRLDPLVKPTLVTRRVYVSQSFIFW